MRLALCLFAFVAALGGAEFRLLSGGETKPSPRLDGTISWDATAGRVVLFGGQDNTPLNDLWTYRLDEARWLKLSPSGALPPARFGHTSLIDSQGRLIVFGGEARGFFSDVWAFDFRANSWRQLAPDNAGPSRRYGHSAIYDRARDRIVISHGFTNSGRFDDTWAFDLRTSTWRDLSPPTGSVRPVRRCLHHAVLDERRGQMLLYGGCASGFGPCPLGDLWSFDLASQRWTEITGGQKPAPRTHYGIAFRSQADQAVLFGGSGAGLLNDVWAFDAAGRQWQSVEPSGDRPSARARHGSTYAPELDTAFFFGGSTPNGLSNELWAYGPSAIRAVVNAFSGVGGAVSPGELVTLFGTFGGTPSVTVGGLAAEVMFADARQINVRVPVNLVIGAEVEVVVAGSGSVRVNAREVNPGLFRNVTFSEGLVSLYLTGYGVGIPPDLAVRSGRTPLAMSSVTEVAAGVLRIDARIPEVPAAELGAFAVTVRGVSSPELDAPQ